MSIETETMMIVMTIIKATGETITDIIPDTDQRHTMIIIGMHI